MKLRYKKAGSQMSTCRMFTRLGDWLCSLRFFTAKMESVRKGKLSLKNESPLEWIIEAVDILGGFFDNWVYLNRVKIRTWKSKWEEIWVDWFSSAFCITFILLSMLNKALKIYNSSVKDLALLGDVCYKRDSSGGSIVNNDDETGSSGTEGP